MNIFGETWLLYATKNNSKVAAAHLIERGFKPTRIWAEFFGFKKQTDDKAEIAEKLGVRLDQPVQADNKIADTAAKVEELSAQRDVQKLGKILNEAGVNPSNKLSTSTDVGINQNSSSHSIKEL